MKCPGCSSVYHPGCASRVPKTSEDFYTKCCGSRSVSPTVPTDFQDILKETIRSLQISMSNGNRQILEYVRSIDEKLDGLVTRVTATEKSLESVAQRVDKVEGFVEAKTTESVLRKFSGCPNAFVFPIKSCEGHGQNFGVSKIVDCSRQNENAVGSVQWKEKGTCCETRGRRNEPENNF